MHGGNFTSLGEGADLDWYEAAIGKLFELKLRARIGPDEKDDKEVRIMNRIVRQHSKGILYEADPRHVEKLLKEMGMDEAKMLTKPCAKSTGGGL